jgi:ribosome-binding factor A
MANEQRRRRVADQIQKELSEIIRLELHDPRVGMITISAVEISADFAYCKVFYTMLAPEAERDTVKAGLKRASGFLRTALGKRLRIHNTPELRFLYDTSIERGVHLSQLIDQAVADDTGHKE